MRGYIIAGGRSVPEEYFLEELSEEEAIRIARESYFAQKANHDLLRKQFRPDELSSQRTLSI
jgi:hypothetical protein